MPAPPNDTFAWAASCSAPATTVVAACARTMLRVHGDDLAAPLRLADALDPSVVAPVAAEGLAPHDLGLLLEMLTGGETRRAAGVHYTPWWLAEGLVQLTMGDRTPEAILDPAVGGGVFLLAALDALVARGVPHVDALARVHGTDVDPAAVAVAEAALGVWAVRQGLRAAPNPKLVVGDALTDAWAPAGLDLVIGNPPFLSQLGRATRRDLAYTDRVAVVLGLRPGPYTDTAALFMARAVQEARDRARVCLILPTSVAAARDSEPIRRLVHEHGAIEAVWRDDGSAFAAGVVTFAPVVVVGGEPDGSVAVVDGAVFEPRLVPAEGDDRTGWAGYLGSGHARLGTDHSTRRLGSLAHVTAGFRDEYYAIAAAITDAPSDSCELPRVLTSGSIDVGAHQWGHRAATIAKRRWMHPVAALDAIAAESKRVGDWASARLVPKILVATQTRIIEAVIDPTGELLPITPVVSVEPHDPQDLARVAAVLLAPAVSRHVVEQRRGTGMSATAVRISAKTLADIPLPQADAVAWDRAAALVDAAPDPSRLEPASLVAIAAEMQLAYGAEDDALVWWRERAKLENA